ncbi:MAG: selenide, water dikinase SelD [Thermoanaerobaculia bacterium]
MAVARDTAPPRVRDLVLVGGGHAHVQVLRSLARMPVPAVRVTVVLDVPVAVYSGMVPGFVSGRYDAEELEIDVVPLARRAGARVVLSPWIGLETGARRLQVEGRPSFPYDVVSFDVGSTVAGLDLPGVREHALSTRPIGRFVERVGERVGRAVEERRELSTVVVGGGAGGVELAFTLEAGIRAAGATPRVTLLQGDDRILPGSPGGLRRRVEAAARRRGIALRVGREVTGVEPSAIVLEGGERLACDLPVWATGAAAHPWPRQAGLPVDERGFIRVEPTLQVEGHPELFAVGDCAALIEHPRTPKAGVYAVRQGPVLARNLKAVLTGKRLRSYEPQGDFLALLNLGDGSAIGSKWGLSFEGSWAMRLKDRIDRRFMRRFQVLSADGRVNEEFRRAPAMAVEMEMVCGGCAAKAGQTTLARALARLPEAPADPSVALGLSVPDDAAIWRPGSPGPAVATSVDLFRPFTDDPWLVGRVAAVNALSDLWAKGASPRWAQALVTLEEEASDDEQEELLFQLLAGARSLFDEVGVSLVGGHTSTGPALQIGFAVEGPAGDQPMSLGGLRPGQALLLTKPLGTGVLFRADGMGRLAGRWLAAALESMGRPNREAGAVAVELGATACTDVTGFGLAGHAAEMARASAVTARIEVDHLPALPGALELLAVGLRSTAHERNERLRRGLGAAVEVDDSPRSALCFDPQTSGGLLFGIAADRVEEALKRLRRGGDRDARRIGTVGPGSPGGPPVRLIAGAGR